MNRAEFLKRRAQGEYKNLNTQNQDTKSQTAQSQSQTQTKTMTRAEFLKQREAARAKAAQTTAQAKTVPVVAQAKTVPVVQQSAAKNALDKRNYYQAPVQRGGGMKRSEPKEEGRGFLSRAADTVIGGAEGWGGSMYNAVADMQDRMNQVQAPYGTGKQAQYQKSFERERQELVKMLQDNQKTPGRWSEKQIQAKKNLLADRKQVLDDIQRAQSTHAAERGVQAGYGVADDIQDASAAHIERAKEGLGGVGSTLVDAGASVTQMAMDIPLKMLGFGIRAYGGATQEARREQEAQRAREEAAAALEGRYLAPLTKEERIKQLNQRGLYGLANTGVEIFTEKMFNKTLPTRLAYGSGSVDEMVENGIKNAVEKFAKTETGRRVLGGALNFGAGAVSEGMEELIGDWIEWQLPRLYGGDVKSVGEVAQDSLYDFLVGATSGAMGGAVTPSTYAYGLDTETLTGRQNQAIDQAYQTMQDTGLFSPESNAQRQQSRKTVDFTGDRLGLEKTASVRQNIPTEMVQEPQAQPQDVLRDAAREVVSSREAERVLNDSAALRALEARTGQAITGTKSQQRQAVKAALEEQGRQNQVQQERGPVQDTTMQTARVQEAPAAQSEAQTAQAVQTRRAVRTAADTFGENGAKAFRATAGQTNDPAGYYAGFAAYYQAGINGVDQASVNTEYAGRLSEGQRFAAYSAGRNDAAESLRREQAAAPYAKTAGTDSGLVYDDFVRDAVESGRTYTDVDNNTRVYLTAETAEQVNQVAKALGLRAQFVDSVFHGKANAKIEGDTVFIEKNNRNPVLFLMGHEATHRMQQLAPTEYRALRDMIANEEQDRIQDRIASYAAQGVDLTIEDAMDEITADRVGRMMENGSYLDEFIQAHRKDKTVLEKLRDAFRALMDRLTGKAKRQAETAEAKLTAALEAAEKKAGELKKERAGQEKGETRYSINEQFSEEIQAWAEENRPGGERFVLGSTGPVLQGLGAIESDIYMEGSKINLILEQHPEMTLREIQNIPDLLENPALVLKSRNVGRGTRENSRLVLFGSMKAADGRPVLCVLDLRPSERGFTLNDMQKVTSAYTKDNHPVEFIQQSEVLFADKKRTTRLLSDIGFQAPMSCNRSGYIGSIAYAKDNVKITGAPFSEVFTQKNEGRYSLKTDNLFYIDETNQITEEKKKLSWDEAADMLDKQTGLSYRFYASDDPMSRGEYAMFSDDPDANGSNYGGDNARAFSVSDSDLTNISDLTEQIIEARHKTDDLGFGALDDYDFVSDEDFAKLFDPENIVDSADAWDNEELVNWFAENVAIPLDLDGVKTEDGAIVFNRDLIRRNIPAEVYYAQGRFSLKAGTETQTAAALHEEERLLREQTRELAQLQKENQTLTESRDYWKGQTQRTKQATTDKKAVAKAAKELVQRYGAKLEGTDIAPQLQALYDYMASGTDGKDELTYSGVRERAEAIAKTLVEHAVETDDGLQRQYSDLRRYLRDTALVVTDRVKGDITDYGDFRKRNLGRMKLVNGTQTNIDQVYQELSYNWPEFFDEQIQSTPTDQLLQISMVLNDINRVTEYNPYQDSMQQATAGAANEIIETFFDLPQTKKTFADRAALRLEEAKAQGKIRLAETKAQSAAKLAEQKAQSREAMDRALLGEQMAGGRALAKQKRIAAERLQKVRDQKAEKLAQLREANRARVEQVIAKERQTRERQLERLKDRYQTSEAKGRDRRAARELRAKITRHVADLSRKLLKPTDQQHIPEVLRKPVAKLLESINLESAYTVGEDGKRTKGGEGDPVKRTRAFLALREAYQKIQSDEGSDITFDEALLGGEEVKGSFSAVIALSDKRLADMNQAELEQVWQVIRTVEYSVQMAGKTLAQSKFQTRQEWANAIRADTANQPKRKKSAPYWLDVSTPYTYFARLGNAGKAVFRMLRNAQDHQQLMLNQVVDRVKDIVDEKTVKRLERETVRYTTEGGEALTLTRAQIMELYALTRREQAQEHIYTGGIVVGEVKHGRKTVVERSENRITLNPNDAAALVGELTDREVKITEDLQGLTSGLLASFGNEASMRAYGYKKFTEKHYWPINSADEVLTSSAEKNPGNVRSLKNVGMAQNTQAHANNAIELNGLFSTFSQHTGEMVDYAAWLCPVEDANKLLNFKFLAQNEDGKTYVANTMKFILERVEGKSGTAYWRQLLDNIQNGIGSPRDSASANLGERLIGNFKGAKVGANVRVVLQQPTAIFRAHSVMSDQDLAKGFVKGVTAGNGWEKALQYSPIAMRKDAGGFDISAPATMKETLFGGKTVRQEIRDKAGALAGAADAWTWGKLWNACEWTVSRKNRALKPGSEAFYQEVARQFAEVIDQTQVVDGVLQRANIMRSRNGIARQATAFMGEPLMTVNLFMRDWGEMIAAKGTDRFPSARKQVARTAVALAMSGTLNALVVSLWDAVRDDDEDKKYWERFWSAFTGITGDEETLGEEVKNFLLNGNFAQGLNPLTMIPFVKDIFSLAQGYEVTRSDMETLSSIVSAVTTMSRNIDGKGQNTRVYGIKQLMVSISELFGVPVGALTRDIFGTLRSWAVETDNVAMQYGLEKAIYNIGYSSNRGRYLDILYRALEQEDTASYQHIRSDLMERMELDGKDIDSGLKSRYEKAVEKDSDYTLPQVSRDLIGVRARAETETEPSFDAGQLSAAQYQSYAKDRGETYRTVLDTAAGYAAYDGLNDEDRNRLETAAWTYAEETALAANSGGKAPVSTKWVQNAQEAQKKYGIKPGTYALLKTQAGQLKGVKDAEGKTITNSKGLQIMEVIYSTKGLNDRQRTAMAEYLGVGEKVRKLNRAAVEAKLDQLR